MEKPINGGDAYSEYQVSVQKRNILKHNASASTMGYSTGKRTSHSQNAQGRQKSGERGAHGLCSFLPVTEGTWVHGCWFSLSNLSIVCSTEEPELEHGFQAELCYERERAGEGS